MTEKVMTVRYFLLFFFVSICFTGFLTDFIRDFGSCNPTLNIFPLTYQQLKGKYRKEARTLYKMKKGR